MENYARFLDIKNTLLRDYEIANQTNNSSQD